MGTSSGGSSGSGSGLGDSGAGDTGNTYISHRGAMVPKQLSKHDTDKRVGDKFRALFSRASTYTNESFCNKHIQQLYKELFALAELLKDTDDIERIGRRYNLKMTDPGFFFALIEALNSRFSTADIDPRCINTTRALLDRFLQEALGKKSSVIPTGNGKEIIKAMGANVDFWKHLSGHFLLQLAYTLYLKEIERPEAIFAIKQSVEKRTNTVMSNYADGSISKEGKVDYRGLLEYICSHWEWFTGEMTK